MNQRSRSSHGTAAFAGEVEGSTKSVVTPSIRSWKPVLGPLVEDAPVCLFPDERDDARLQLERDRPEPLTGSREVGGAKVARAACRPSRSVREPDAEVEQVRCSWGSSSRGVNPAASSSRQKSLRGFAKAAPAAALVTPGLMPQKTSRTPGARTSGTAESVRRLPARARRGGARGASAASRRRRSIPPVALLRAGAP